MLAQGEDVVAIPGTRRREALDENIGAVSLQLTTADPLPAVADTPPGAPGAVALNVGEYTTSTQ